MNRSVPEGNSLFSSAKSAVSACGFQLENQLTAQDGAAGRACFAEQSDEYSFSKPFRYSTIEITIVFYKAVSSEAAFFMKLTCGASP